MDPIPPKTDATPPPPPGGSPAGGAPEGDAATMVAEAKASGALKPLEDLIAQEGWDMDAGTMMLLAAKKGAPGTQGKSPEELAKMLQEDPGVYEDLQALMPGGSLDKMYGKDDAKSVPKDEEGESSEKEMGDFMEKSPMMKGSDAKKGAGMLGKMGMKKPGDLDKNAGGKAKFLSRFGG